jgi:hypothetical protein
MKFSSFDALKSWWLGRDDAIDSNDKGAITPAGDDGEGVEDPDDLIAPCPLGGEHEIVEIRAATAREPLGRYCVRCKEAM